MILSAYNKPVLLVDAKVLLPVPVTDFRTTEKHWSLASLKMQDNSAIARFLRDAHPHFDIYLVQESTINEIQATNTVLAKNDLRCIFPVERRTVWTLLNRDAPVVLSNNPNVVQSTKLKDQNATQINTSICQWHGSFAQWHKTFQQQKQAQEVLFQQATPLQNTAAITQKRPRASVSNINTTPSRQEKRTLEEIFNSNIVSNFLNTLPDIEQAQDAPSPREEAKESIRWLTIALSRRKNSRTQETVTTAVLTDLFRTHAENSGTTTFGSPPIPGRPPPVPLDIARVKHTVKQYVASHHHKHGS